MLLCGESVGLCGQTGMCPYEQGRAREHRDHRDKSQPKFGKDRVVPSNIFDNITFFFT